MATGSFKQILRQIRILLEGHSAEPTDDVVLLQRFAGSRDEAAFEALVHRHGAMVRNVCRGVLRNAADADDAFQATFLVLARRAGSFRRGGSVASWLHGIAYRTALKAQTQAARRRHRERFVTHESVETDPTDALARQELGPLVHEALNQLPDRLRGPLVLCYLEGKTVAEAAQVLGCPFGSMSRLLDRGRQLLRERLEQRGVVVSLIGLGGLLAPEAGMGAMPASMAAATARSAARFSGQSTSTAATATLAESLAKGVLHDMYQRKMKWIVSAVLALVLVGSGTSVAIYAAGKAVTIQPGEQLEPEKKELSNKEKIIGTWELTKSDGDVPVGSILEFTKDGKLKLTAKIDGKEVNLTQNYAVDGDKLSTSDLNRVDGWITTKIKKLTDTELVIQVLNGTPEFRRKKK